MAFKHSHILSTYSGLVFEPRAILAISELTLGVTF